MIIDERCYDVLPARLKDYLDLYVAKGRVIQESHLGPLTGFFTVDTGMVNQVVHWWRYESLADREIRRASLEADPDWQAFREEATPCLLAMRSRILRPTSFSPFQ